MVHSPGSYHADVYSKYGFDSEDSIYEGTVDFEVGDVYSQLRSEIIGQYQSDCYHNVGVKEESLSMTTFNLYPNPLKDAGLLNIEAFSTGMTVLEIFTITGREIFSKQYEENRQIQDSFIKNGLFPAPGIYVIRLRNDDHVLVRKITVL
jgi:hypothetical protein